MKIKHTGLDHVRVVTSTDLGLTEAGDIAEQVWEWNAGNRHVLEVPDEAAELLRIMPNLTDEFDPLPELPEEDADQHDADDDASTIASGSAKPAPQAAAGSPATPIIGDSSSK